MFKKFLIPLMPLFLTACNSSEEQTDRSEDVSGSEEKNTMTSFTSAIRPEMDSIDLSKTYKDTLELLNFNDNFDYPKAKFKTKQGQTVSMISNEPFEEEWNGSILLVEWKLDSFFEAGENELMYMDLKLESYQILKKKANIRDFLYDGFIDDFLSNDRSLMKKYEHPDQPVHFAYNPGAACVLGGTGYEPEFTLEMFGDGYSVVKGKPEGSFCEGYPRVTNGFYYVKLTEDSYPTFVDFASTNEDMFTEVIPQMPDGAEEVYLVRLILDEWQQANLYFILVENEFYLWIEDYCDCSA